MKPFSTAIALALLSGALSLAAPAFAEPASPADDAPAADAHVDAVDGLGARNVVGERALDEVLGRPVSDHEEESEHAEGDQQLAHAAPHSCW